MPVTPIYPTALSAARGNAHRVHTPMVIGVLLFALLIFSTVTVFVQAAWPMCSLEIGVFALVGGYLLINLRSDKMPGASGAVPWLVYLIPVWGLVQLGFHTTSSSFDTRSAVLRWASLAGVFFLIQTIASTREARRAVLSAFLMFATAMAVLCLAQLFTSEGQVFWIFSSGYPDVYATFPSYNNYAQFVELALPIALWRAVREGWRSWWYPLAGGLLFASVIGCASRAGTVICAGELFATLFFGLRMSRLAAGWRRDVENSPDTSALSIRDKQISAATLLAIPTLALVFTTVVGWERVLPRFRQNDPYLVRQEFLVAAVDMTMQKPVMGFGLGTFPEVYQRYAIKDFPFRANHAHNDWAEFSAEGGIPFLLLVLSPCIAAVPLAIRHPWGLGIIGVMIHACVDYPFPRPAVSAWFFALLSLLWATRRAVEAENEEIADLPQNIHRQRPANFIYRGSGTSSRCVESATG